MFKSKRRWGAHCSCMPYKELGNVELDDLGLYVTQVGTISAKAERQENHFLFHEDKNDDLKENWNRSGNASIILSGGKEASTWVVVSLYHHGNGHTKFFDWFSSLIDWLLSRSPCYKWMNELASFLPQLAGVGKIGMESKNESDNLGYVLALWDKLWQPLYVPGQRTLLWWQAHPSTSCPIREATPICC